MVKPAAIMFEPDGFATNGKELVGRQMAGSTFLRAAVEACPENESVTAFTASHRAFETFTAMVKSIRPGQKTSWCRPQHIGALKGIGTLYMPDPNIEWPANLRLREGLDSYSITGITHTTATHAIMDLFKRLLTAPLANWDALICTSKSVKASVQTVIDAQSDYLSWRLGMAITPNVCQLPIIPLGIHTSDFHHSDKDHQHARKTLGIAPRETVFLYVGRFSIYTKANPYPIYTGLERAAKQTGKPITLIECGWHLNGHEKAKLEKARAALCPSLKTIEVDGRDQSMKKQCLAAADVFTSLSDNVQETFGLTPLEAMAAGLPVLISDWDGYKDLVSDGNEGFLIPTYMAESTDDIAHKFEGGMVYERYCATLAQITAVDIEVFADRAIRLMENKELRFSMGSLGRSRATRVYDWRIVFSQYMELWTELEAIRLSARSHKDQYARIQTAPRASAARPDPDRYFSTYPSAFLTHATLFEPAEGHMPGSTAMWQQGKALLDLGRDPMPDEHTLDMILSTMQDGSGHTATDIGNMLSMDHTHILRIMMLLLKAGRIRVAG